MAYEDVKVICKVTLLNKKLFIVDLGVGKMNLTMIMESVFSFLLSYFSIIF